MALHLLQAGVELNVIRSWLGHVSITTMSQYIEIDMAMKRKAIERCPPPVPVQDGESRWHASKDIVQWLEDLRVAESYVQPDTRPGWHPPAQQHDVDGSSGRST